MKVYNFNRMASISRPTSRRRSQFGNKKTTNFSGFGISFGKIFDKIGENTFAFQVLGLAIITVAVVISYQTISGDLNSSVALQAKNVDSSSDVHMYTNFNSPNEAKLSPSLVREIKQDSPLAIVTVESMPTATEGRASYVVKAGDTLSDISAQTKVSVKALMVLNGISDPGALRIGQELKLVEG
jgi:LysM repeat protein